MLNYYRALIALRKSDALRELFTYGSFVPRWADTETVFGFERRLGEQRVLVAANFGAEPAAIRLGTADAELLLSNCGRGSAPADEVLTLAPCESIVLKQ